MYRHLLLLALVPPYAYAADPFPMDMPPQILVDSLCDARRDAERSGQGADPMLERGAAMYKARTGQDFPSGLCIDISKGKLTASEVGIPDRDWAGTTLARVQRVACDARRGRSLYIKQRQEMATGDMGSPQLNAMMRSAVQKEIDTATETLQRLSATFLKVAKKKVDTRDCTAPGFFDGKVVRACFYFSAEPIGPGGIVEHNFLGVIVTDEEGDNSYDALGECHTASCEKEIVFLEKQDRVGSLGPAQCTTSEAQFHRAFEAAYKAIHPDGSLQGWKDGLGFLLVPVTCGYSKPCGMATRRGWDAVKQTIGR